MTFLMTSGRVAGFGTAKQVQDRVQDVLAIMCLDALARQFPGQLSGGQQQRVALARAIVPGTGVVLFDEPLSNVDARIREQLREEIRRMQRRLKFSALYVTHDQVEAMAVADQIAVLDDGRIVQRRRGTAAAGRRLRNCRDKAEPPDG